MKKEVSERKLEEKEQVIQENIKKYDEQYQKNKEIPQDYKKQIKNRIFKNTIIAVIAISYLILINVLSLYIETVPYIIGVKILSVVLSVISVIYFELCYRKDNGYLFMHGVELLFLATITLFSVNAYFIYFVKYNNILIYILIAVIIYYIIKTIFTLRFMKREYYDSQNDIKEIVKKGRKNND